MVRLRGAGTRSSVVLTTAWLGTLAGCDPIPVFQLGEGAFITCADASDLACKPFGAPATVPEVASPSDDDEKPTLTADMLEMYFLSDRSAGLGSGDVWMSTRANAADPWGSPTLNTVVSTTSRETSPAISADGLTLWVASDRPGGQGGLDIWVSTRTSDAGTWSTPVPVTALNSPADEIPRPPGEHSLVMPLSRRATASDPYQVFVAGRMSTSASWGAPAAETSVDTANVDDDGYLTDDGLTLYFSSDRLNGSQDLFVTERPTLSAPFAVPVALAELNTTAYAERDPWVSADGHTIYFASDRSGTLQIYVATR
jgi:Tol biopolymer transport system component